LDVNTIAVSGSEYRLDQPEVAAVLNMQGLYLTLLEHKQRRGYDNLFIDKAALPDLLARCTLNIDYPLTLHKRVQTDARMALCTYVDRFIARQERRAENAMLAPRNLSLKEAPGAYLLQPPYQPLVNEAGLDDDLSVSSAPLKASEVSLLALISQWWAKNHVQHPGVKIYILRNLPRIGIGLYQQSGFYPDFILWVKRSKPSSQRIVLLEPHGLHHETPNALQSDKVKALAAFRELGKVAAFRKKKSDLDGHIISETPANQIPGGVDGLSREKLARKYAVILSKATDDWWVSTALGL